MKVLKSLLLIYLLAFIVACADDEQIQQVQVLPLCDNMSDYINADNSTPIISLMRNGMNIGFNNEITFDTTAIEASDNYTLRLSSSAVCGIRNANISLSARYDLQTNLLLTLLGTIDIANAEGSFHEPTISQAIPHYNSIKGSTTVDISLVGIASVIASLLKEDTKIQIELELVDNNSANIIYLETDIIVEELPISTTIY